MKRILKVFLAMCLVFIWTFTALAAGMETYRLDDGGMSIDIPSDLMTFTRDMSEDDPVLTEYGVTKDYVDDILNSSGMYIDAIGENSAFEITVIIKDGQLRDFNHISDSELNAAISLGQFGFESMGLTYIKHELYQQKQTKFIKLYASQTIDDVTIYKLVYYTVFGGREIAINFNSLAGEISPDDEAVMKSITDSVCLYYMPLDAAQEPEAPEENLPAPEFTYTNSESGTTFTVPENWVEKSLMEGNEKNTAKFVSREDSGASVVFTYSDLYEDARKNGTLDPGKTRADYDNSILSKKDIADILGCEVSLITMKPLSGREYYYAELSSDNSKLLPIPMIAMIRIENGNLYMFQFFGTSESPVYDDFLSMVSSMVYPGEDKAPDVTEENTDNSKDIAHKDAENEHAGEDTHKAPVKDSPSPDAHGKGLTGINILLSIIITVVIYSLPVMIYRWGIVKKPVESKKAKKITIIYGICAFIVMSAVLIALSSGAAAPGAAIVFWSGINYKVLTWGGKKKESYDKAEFPGEPGGTRQETKPEAEPENIPEEHEKEEPSPSYAGEEAEPEENSPKVSASPHRVKVTAVRRAEAPAQEKPTEPEAPGDTPAGEKTPEPVSFCKNCGAPLQEDYRFCTVCGTKV